MAAYRMLANCMVGLGFSYRGFQEGLRRRPDLIGCDAGSADFGPAFLGSGRDPKSVASVTRDLEIMLAGAREIGVPLVIGSCGGAGAAPHLRGYRDIVAGLAERRGERLRVALITADVAPAALHAALDEHRVHPLGVVPALRHEDVDASAAVVAMMGAGPFAEALDAGADVVLAGRCADPAIFAGGALLAGAPPGPAWHAAKCIDKGYLATVDPGAGSPVLATVDDEGFTVEPTKQGARCTVATVARIMLHENPDPYRVAEPTGTIETGDCVFTDVGEGAVRVEGSAFAPAPTLSVKLEGARHSGHRAVGIVGLRDPRLIARLDEFLDAFRQRLARSTESIGIDADAYRVRFLPYGRNAVLGEIEPALTAGETPHEVGLVIDVVADTAETAAAVVGRAGPVGTRFDLLDALDGGGNFAYPFSPNRLDGGEVFEWSVWHRMEVADEREPFGIEYVELPAPARLAAG